MKSFNLSAFVALALSLAVSAAPTSTSVKTTHVVAREEAVPSDEEFLGPLLRIGDIISKLPKRVAAVARDADDDLETTDDAILQKINSQIVHARDDAVSNNEAFLPLLHRIVNDSLPKIFGKEKKKVSHSTRKVAAHVAQAENDALGAARNVASEALPAVDSTFEDLSLRDMENVDKKKPKKSVKKSKAKNLKVAPPAPEAAADDDGASDVAEAADLADVGGTAYDVLSDALPEVGSLLEGLFLRDTQNADKKRRKKHAKKSKSKILKVATPAPEAAADDEATTDATDAAASDAAATADDIPTEKSSKKHSKKSKAKKSKAANPAPETDAADDEATAATTESDDSAAASPDASAATDDLSTRAADIELPFVGLLPNLLRKAAARRAAAAAALAPVSETAAAAEAPAAAADVAASVPAAAAAAAL